MPVSSADTHFVEVARRVCRLLILVVLLGGCGESKSSQAASTTAATARSTSSLTTEVPIAEMMPCPKYRASVTVGSIQDPQLTELSGLAMSVRNPGVMWTHNDSGDSARIFAVKQTGEVLSTITLASTSVFDTEDIAVSHGSPSEVWVADIGDNFRFRNSVDLYHFPEPDATQSSTVEPKHVSVRYQDPEGSGTYSIDAESFFVDRRGNGYIVEKTQNKMLAWVFEISATDLQSESAIARPILQITGNSNGNGVGPTGADLSADGTTLAIKNYSETFVWRFTESSSIPAVLAKQPKASCVVAAGLGEAITFDGGALLTVEEGVGKPIRRTNLL